MQYTKTPVKVWLETADYSYQQIGAISSRLLGELITSSKVREYEHKFDNFPNKMGYIVVVDNLAVGDSENSVPMLEFYLSLPIGAILTY